jgi:hypothetical protein
MINYNQYDDLEDTLLEVLQLSRIDKNFLKKRENLEALYECSLQYCRLKLEKFKNLRDNPKKYVKFSPILKESISDKKYLILQEGILDSISDFASSAYEKVKSTVSNVIDYAKQAPGKFLQSVADVVSIFDPTGLVDLINGSIYFSQGENLSAFFCALGAAFTLPGFISTLSGVGAVAGVPMIVAGKTLKGILKFGGKISETLLKFGAKILKMGGVVEKLLQIGSKIPGLGKFLEFFKNTVPKFVKAVDEGGKSESILAKVFGSAESVIKAPGKAAETLVSKGTALAGEKTAEKLALHMPKSKLGKAIQIGGAGLMTAGTVSAANAAKEGEAGEQEDELNNLYDLSDEDLVGI